jgi:hypothetical protein
LRVASTSPHCEPDHFVSSFRLLAAQILRYYRREGDEGEEEGRGGGEVRCLYDGPRRKIFVPLSHQRKWRQRSSEESDDEPR